MLINSTGYSKEKILEDLKFGNGPTLLVTNNGLENLGARVSPESFKKGQMLITADFMKKLESTDAGSKEYKELVNFFVATVLHEYTHYGDRDNNGGKITGHWTMVNGVKIPGNVTWPNDHLEKGSQPLSVSHEGERGQDIDVYGFSQTSSLSEDGTYEVNRIKFNQSGGTIRDKI